ncbi:potassium channel family protein [Halobacteriaceae archaeon GCM10025711]
MYVIIVGAGQIGRPLIEIATYDNHEVVVIERDEERADAAAATFDCLVLNADATVKETLEEAGADRADAVISTTDQDATNIMISLLAQELDVPSIVSVVHNPEHMGLFRRIGVNVMENPQRLIANYLFRAVVRPSIKDYMKVGETAEVFEITVGEDAPTAGKTIADAASEGVLPEDVLVVAVERGDQVMTPRGETTIQAGDLVTVFSERGATPEVTDRFGHYEDHNGNGRHVA